MGGGTIVWSAFRLDTAMSYNWKSASFQRGTELKVGTLRAPGGFFKSYL